jgi:hypothetical protein
MWRGQCWTRIAQIGHPAGAGTHRDAGTFISMCPSRRRRARRSGFSCDKSQRLGMDALLYLAGFLGEIDLHGDVSHLEQ